MLGTHLYYCPRGPRNTVAVCRAQGGKPLSDTTGHCKLKSFPSSLFRPKGVCLRWPGGHWDQEGMRFLSREGGGLL